MLSLKGCIRIAISNAEGKTAGTKKTEATKKGPENDPAVPSSSPENSPAKRKTSKPRQQPSSPTSPRTSELSDAFDFNDSHELPILRAGGGRGKNSLPAHQVAPNLLQKNRRRQQRRKNRPLSPSHLAAQPADHPSAPPASRLAPLVALLL